MANCESLRISFFGIDEVRDLKVEGKVGLEILWIDSVLYGNIRHKSRSDEIEDCCIRIYRWRGVMAGSPHAPKRSLVAYRAEAASMTYIQFWKICRNLPVASE